MIIKNWDRLARTEDRKILLKILEESLHLFSPEKVVEDHLNKNDPLSGEEEIVVISIGKAATGMFKGALNFYKSRIKKGIIATNEDQSGNEFGENIKFLKGNHPFPGKDSVYSAEYIIDFLKKEDKPVLLLLSGGGSAIIEKPLIKIEEYNKIIKCLMDNGADIYILNSVRCIFSLIKCGKLLNFYRGKNWSTLIISDVPGDDISIIASGLTRYWDPKIESIQPFLKKCNIKLPKIGEGKNYKGKISNEIILRNKDFLKYFERKLEEIDYEVINLGSGINLENDVLATWLINFYNFAIESKRPKFAIIGGGESTVQVKGTGIGGRNLELSLRVIKGLKGEFTFLAFGTDGIDGNSPAAGGLVDYIDKSRIKEEEIDYYLENNDSFTLLNKIDSAVISGKTGNNVSDIFILLKS